MAPERSLMQQGKVLHWGLSEMDDSGVEAPLEK